MQLLTKLKDILRFLFSGEAATGLRTRVLADLPKALEANVVYLIGEEGYYLQAALLCPCGCKSRVILNLVPPARPLWKIRCHRDGSLTASPSVWRNTGCYSHFWIRHGRILWVGRGECPRR